MGNRSIFLYFVEIDQGFRVITLPASVPFGGYVSGEGSRRPRCGVTEREDQIVCIDCTWNAQDVDPGR
jgi:hypothetical protein